MKSYEEVTKSVMERSKEIMAAKARRSRIINNSIRGGATCLVLVGAIGFGAWWSGRQSSDIVLSSGRETEDPYSTTFIGYLYTGESLSDNNDYEGSFDAFATNMEPVEARPWYENTTCSTSCPVNISPGMITCDWAETEHHHSQSEDYQSSHLPTMIFDYESDYAHLNSDLKIPPENGTVHVTQALFDAVKRYGDLDEYGCCENKYIVVIDYYVDGKHINPTEEFFESERVRLQKLLGDISGFSFETIGRNSGGTEYYDIHACLTKSQISNIGCIAADENFGCVIYLRDNYYKFNGILPINNP